MILESYYEPNKWRGFYLTGPVTYEQNERIALFSKSLFKCSEMASGYAAILGAKSRHRKNGILAALFLIRVFGTEIFREAEESADHAVYLNVPYGFHLLAHKVRFRAEEFFLFDEKHPLGRGGTKNVYLGINLTRREKFAASFSACFKHEIEPSYAEAKLQRMVGEIFACTYKDGHFIAAYPLANRGTLHDPLGPLPTKGELVMRAIEAVERVHEKGIIVGDINKSNFLLHESEGVLVLRINDFGLGYQVGEPQETPITSTSVKAPEHTIKTEKVRLATDIFQLGLVLWEITHENRPAWHNGKDLSNYESTWLGACALHINHPFETLLLEMTHPDYRERPTIQEVKSRFQKIKDKGR